MSIAAYREQDVLQKHESICQVCRCRIIGILVKGPAGDRQWKQANYDGRARLYRLHSCEPAKAA